MGERESKILQDLEERVIAAFRGEGSGHDHHHILRVKENARRILEEEGEGNSFLVASGALLHDVGDPKFFDGDPERGNAEFEEWIKSVDLFEEEAERLRRIHRSVSFKGAGVEDAVPDRECAIVQDADRLDAMGAIGIARAFSFGGNKGRPIHVPGEEGSWHGNAEEYRSSESPTIAHFHEKLLHLRDRMKTDTGMRWAIERHRFMETFLDRFHKEWKGEA